MGLENIQNGRISGKIKIIKKEAPGTLIVLMTGVRLWVSKDIDLTQEIITLDVEDVTELIFIQRKDGKRGFKVEPVENSADKVIEMSIPKQAILFTQKVDMDSVIYKAVFEVRTGIKLQQGQMQ